MQPIKYVKSIDIRTLSPRKKKKLTLFYYIVVNGPSIDDAKRWTERKSFIWNSFRKIKFDYIKVRFWCAA